MKTEKLKNLQLTCMVKKNILYSGNLKQALNGGLVGYQSTNSIKKLGQNHALI